MINIEKFLEEVVEVDVSVAYKNNSVFSYTGEVGSYKVFEDELSILFEDDSEFSFSIKNGKIDGDILHLYDGDMEASIWIFERV